MGVVRKVLCRQWPQAIHGGPRARARPDGDEPRACAARPPHTAGGKTEAQERARQLVRGRPVRSCQTDLPCLMLCPLTGRPAGGP